MYFIYDCNDNVVGNPKGYRTYRGAERQQNSGKLYSKILDIFVNRPNRKSPSIVCSIKLRVVK